MSEADGPVPKVHTHTHTPLTWKYIFSAGMVGELFLVWRGVAQLKDKGLVPK